MKEPGLNRRTSRLVAPIVGAACVLVIGSGCGRAGDIPESTTPASVPVGTVVVREAGETARTHFTHHRPDGNRLVGGAGRMPDVPPVDIPLEGVPEWVVGAWDANGSLWVAVLEDGKTQGFRLTGSGVTPVAVSPERLPPDMPPLAVVGSGLPMLVTPPTSAASTLTHPVPLVGPFRLAFIDRAGDLVLWREAESARIPVQALPDGRVLSDERGRLLVLSGPTDRYEHGVLADKIEASEMTLVETEPVPGVAATFAAPEGTVFEAVAPVWADVTGDGRREIAVTASSPDDGSRIVIFTEAGELVAEGPPIGRGYRWRHLLAAGPVGPNGEIEVVAVRTPHIGGSVEFYRVEEHSLHVVAEASGYSSHVLGSRNLDMGLLGDMNGDGHLEVVVPNQTRTELAGIQRTPAGAEPVWRVPAGGTVVTNIAAVTSPDGRLGMGVGLDSGVLRVWPE